MNSPAAKWAKKYEWPTTYNDIGPLFLAKASKLAKPNAWVSMIQPANAVLFNWARTAVRLREKLFTSFHIAEVTNLSALRFVLFSNAVKGPCIVTYQNRTPSTDDIIVYICPKASRTSEDPFRVIIEPNDISEIPQSQALRHPHIWTALAWGGWRDVELIHRLPRASSIGALKRNNIVATREGIIRGNRRKTLRSLVGKRILNTKDFAPKVFLTLDASTLPVNDDPCVDGAASTDFTAFQVPQLVIKQSWRAGPGRFRAAIVRSSQTDEGILCSDSYVSVHALNQDTELLETACLIFNSSFATYYQLLTSGQFAAFVPKPIEGELRQVPLPKSRPGVLEGLSDYAELDERVCDLFNLMPADRVLINDLFTFTLPDFKGDADSPGRQPTPRRSGKDPDLRAYAEQFMRVLHAGFGSDKGLRATIFQESTRDTLPVRLMGIHMHWPEREHAIELELIESSRLLERLMGLYRDIMRPDDSAPGFVFERQARLYTEHRTPSRIIPSIMMVKPDQRRHWTRSQGMRDADEVVAEILKMKWFGESR
jgi:hypothetical protein